MDYSDVNDAYQDVIRQMRISEDGSALVVFRDGSAGWFPNPEALMKTLEEQHGKRREQR